MAEFESDPSFTPSATTLTPADPYLFVLTHSILQNYNREATIVSSCVSVLVVILLAICACCTMHRCTKKQKNIEDKLSELVDDSSFASIASSVENPFEKRAEERYIARKMTSWGNKGKKLILHKNIITPDRNIAFVVPTISLHSQVGLSKDSSKPDDELPSCSRSLANAPMLAHQYYPQLASPADPSPRIGFCLFYELATQILYVRLLGGQNFPEDNNHYVTVKIYPGRGAKQRTKEYQGDSPIINQEFSFHVRKGVVNTKVLKLRVVGIASRHANPKAMLGCVNLALKDVSGFENEDFTEDLRTGQMWKRLDQPSDISEGVKLQVTLKWSTEPAPGLLTLKVVEASGLHENNDNEYTSTYVKVTLQEQGRNIKSRKTRLIRWGSVPYFDDVFVVTIPQELLSQISFLLVVIARGRLGSKVVLGKISIGPVPFADPSAGSTTSGTDFWEDMCHQPNIEIVRWLHLLP